MKSVKGVIVDLLETALMKLASAENDKMVQFVLNFARKEGVPFISIDGVYVPVPDSDGNISELQKAHMYRCEIEGTPATLSLGALLRGEY